MVDLRGFRDMVNAVGGLNLNVRDRIPIGGVGARSPAHRARRAAPQRLPDAVVRPLAGERRRLLADGPAEVRDERDAAAASPQTVVTKFEAIAKASEQLVTTDLPASRARHLRRARAEGAHPAGRAPSRSCRRRSAPATPTSTQIQSMVTTAIDKSEGKAAAARRTARRHIHSPARPRRATRKAASRRSAARSATCTTATRRTSPVTCRAPAERRGRAVAGRSRCECPGRRRRRHLEPA